MNARAEAASRVKAWTRGRFGDVTVMVSELESAVPGLPPVSNREALAVVPGIDCSCC